ncbi:carbohydrate binding domain-containing protein [Bacillus sp. FJAT-45066]|uniref:carbohydrate binding domain-containing protein n=1 Tax=Bacillus sp. FJAT-45066 TaxID=2011010 RepID=UPI000BB87308|nr:carbohydrate binding domain-containing protein [Bacillus sp. FJAT-45066]
MVKKSFSLFLVFLLVMSNFSSTLAANNENATTNDDWTLVWEDNFEGSELDLSKWSYDKGNGFYDNSGTYISGWGNEELQYYQEDNVRVSDGKLIIEGKKETASDDKGTYQYTSGKIHTQGKFSQKYGKFEARMALPEGQGYWPAFWMMPEEDKYGGWAASGEIDIMENAGGTPHKVGGAIHYGGQWPNNTYTAKDYYFPAGQDVTDFNVYAVEWEPGEIRWYVNGELFQTLNNWSSTGTGNPTKFAYPAPFDQEFYIILNLAIGGWYGGNPDGSTEFPGEMIVDYVKVYELTGRDYLEPVEPVFDPEELPANAKEAIDGNYVYDKDFTKGITKISNAQELENNWDKNFWNLVYLPDFNGNASASVEAIEGKNFAKVDISQGGNQPYSVQLIQNVTLGKGRWYQLSFDAKSTANRNVNVKLGGGPDRGYTAYSPSVDFSLTNEVQSYELAFQMQHETDIASRLEFNMGLNTNPVWIGNVKVEEIDPVDPYNEDQPKTPLRNGNHVYNGSFDLGRIDRMTYWNFNVNNATAEASVHPDARQLEVNIDEAGANEEAVTLVQNGMNLLATDEYKLTFHGKASSNRDIQVAFLSKDGTETYLEKQPVQLTSSMEEKEVTFVMPNETDVEGQLVFYFGGNNHNVVLDNVKLVRLTNNNEALSFDDIFPLKNGDFSNGFYKWDKHIQGDHEPGTSQATINVVEGQLIATIDNEGWEPWHVLLMQNGMDLHPNKTYSLSFEASSTVDRKVEVVLENATYNRFFSEVVDVTDSMQKFEFEFEMSSSDKVDLKYLLGKVANAGEIGNHEVVIDNVRLEVKEDSKIYFPLSNGDFTSELENWHGHVQGIYEGTSDASFYGEDGVANISVGNVGANPWDISLSQEGLTLHENQTYVVEFDAKADIDRKLELVLDNGAPGYHRYFERILDLTEDWNTYRYEFDMPETDTVGLKFLVGKVGGIELEEAHNIYLDNVRLEVKGARAALAGLEEGEEAPIEQPSEPEEPVVSPNEKEWKEVGENLLHDGSFETTTEFGSGENLVEGWNVHNQGVYEDWAGLASFSVENEEAKVQFQQEGWEWWHIQLFQDGIHVPSGMYKIAFDMKSEFARSVKVELAGSGVPIQSFEIDEEMQTYSTIIEVAENGSYKFLIGLGRDAADAELEVPYTMLIDNVKLVAVEELEIVEDPQVPVVDPDEKENETEQPKQETPNNETDQDKTKDEKSNQEGEDLEQEVTPPSSEEDGKALPNTATNTFNALLIGLLMFAIGFGILFLSNKRKLLRAE